MSLPRKSDPSEVQERNGLDHLRVYDPESDIQSRDLLELLRSIETQLKINNMYHQLTHETTITEEDV